MRGAQSSVVQPLVAQLMKATAESKCIRFSMHFFRRTLQDRRGVTAIIFGITATSIIGLVGLATEGGTWYLEKRHGQNTADAAATAGALGLAQGESNAAAVADATAVATLNSYVAGTSNGTVTTVTNTAVTFQGRPGIQSTVTRSVPRLFSALFLGANVSISETATAIISTTGGNACTLALSGGLSIAGSAAINAGGCTLASNETGPNSISFGGANAAVTAGTLVAEGGCSGNGNSGCSGNNLMLYQPPTTNPFTAIYNPATGTGVTLPATTAAANCLTIPTVSGTQAAPTQITPSTTAAYCAGTGKGANSTLKAVGGAYLNFAPGTYFFQDSSLDFEAGTVECTACVPGGAGVTIILTGTSAKNVGTITIGGSAVVTLNAPATNTYNAAFNGVLFYMSSLATGSNGNGNAPVSLSGNGTIQLTGGMYFPTVSVTYSGNVSATNAAVACTEIVGQSIAFTGNSTVNIAGCTGDGTGVAKVQTVELVQ